MMLIKLELWMLPFCVACFYTSRYTSYAADNGETPLALYLHRPTNPRELSWSVNLHSKPMFLPPQNYGNMSVLINTLSAKLHKIEIRLKKTSLATLLITWPKSHDFLDLPSMHCTHCSAKYEEVGGTNLCTHNPYL